MQREPDQLSDILGRLRGVDEKLVVLEADDHRIIRYARTRDTHFLKDGNEIQPSNLAPGDYLEIEYYADEEGNFTAVNVVLLKKGTPAEREAAAEPVEFPKPPPKPEEDERPRLKRGKPEPRPSAEPDPAPETEAAPAPAAGTEAAPAPAPPPAEPRAGDPVIEKARAIASSFMESLPNYYCKEYITRFTSTGHIVSWQPVDVVAADLIFEKGRERYRNITVNGKAFKKSIQELSGAWSTGEFATILANLLDPGTAADFRHPRESSINGRSAAVYDFSVARERSRWTIQASSQMVVPGFRGKVWIERATGRVLRIEEQAVRLPDEFPWDKVESAVDYDYVRFGESQYLAPVHAEILSCERDSSVCSMNRIDFRNYHRFTGESSVTFGDKK